MLLLKKLFPFFLYFKTYVLFTIILVVSSYFIISFTFLVFIAFFVNLLKGTYTFYFKKNLVYYYYNSGVTIVLTP